LKSYTDISTENKKSESVVTCHANAVVSCPSVTLNVSEYCGGSPTAVQA